MITGYFKLKIPTDMLVELNSQLKLCELEDIKFIKIVEEDNSEISNDKLEFSLGGDEVNVIKLLFEATILTATNLAGIYLKDQIKKILNDRNKPKQMAEENETPSLKTDLEIEITYPDGTIIKIRKNQ